MKILHGLFRLVFSRFTLALCSLALQIAIIFIGLSFFSEYIVWLFGGFTTLSIIVVIYILNKNQNPSYKIAWIIPILALPVLGVLLYLFVHTQVGVKAIHRRLLEERKMTKKFLVQNGEVVRKIKKQDELMASTVHYMHQVAGFPVYRGLNTCYFPFGEDKYQDLLMELKKAKKFIFLEYFIIGRGKMWDSILEILKEKVKENVEVRVMYDGMCSIVLLPYDYPKQLKKMGILCKEFMPIKPVVSTHQNNRDHRKICVIDGRVAYTGGVNLADEYINQKERFGVWKDNAVKIEGEAVDNFTIMFLEMWNVDSTSGYEEYGKYLGYSREVSELKMDGYVIPFGDSPLDNQAIGENIYLDILNQAKKYVHIMTPYLVLDYSLMSALIHAAQRGVDVVIMMPHIPDKKLIYYLGRSYYADLIQNGVKIYEYTPGFVHAKMMVSDDEKAVVGSINLDYRSLYLHFECACLFYQIKAISHMENDFQETLKQCQKIQLSDVFHYPLWKRAVGRVLRFFSPLL
jgi:hypothetical protein